VAAVIDLVVTVVGVLLGYVAVSAIAFALRPRAFEWPGLGPFSFGGIWVAVLILYLTIGWTVTGRTIGKQAMGLRVTDARGRRLRGGVALGRALIAGIFPFGLLWCAIDRRNRALHDLITRSRVVYDWLPRRHAPTARPADDRAPVT
jgi:uncharacterized RDD family membrane protein YckC